MVLGSLVKLCLRVHSFYFKCCYLATLQILLGIGSELTNLDGTSLKLLKILSCFL